MSKVASHVAGVDEVAAAGGKAAQHMEALKAQIISAMTENEQLGHQVGHWGVTGGTMGGHWGDGHQVGRRAGCTVRVDVCSTRRVCVCHVC